MQSPRTGVGGLGWVDVPLSRPMLERLNSRLSIMGVQQMSVPYSWTVCRKASWGVIDVSASLISCAAQAA